VVCVDEKTAIGARSRKHPEQRVAPGRAARREFEYIRHGTISVIAALDVHSGEVLTERIAKNDSATFMTAGGRLGTEEASAAVIAVFLDGTRTFGWSPGLTQVNVSTSPTILPSHIDPARMRPVAASPTTLHP
jgi:hypothetical protein